jgi:DNA polymerase-4
VSRLEKYSLKGKTITLKVKFSDFKQVTRNFTFPFFKNDFDSIFETASTLLSRLELQDKKIRLLGIAVSNFEEPLDFKSGTTIQLRLF